MSFNDLPNENLIRIFSYLPVKDKGIVSQVCRKWNEIVSNALCWQHLDLKSFMFYNPLRIPSGEIISSRQDVITLGKLNFLICHIIAIQPSVITLSIGIEVSIVEKQFLQALTSLISHINCVSLENVTLLWDGCKCLDDNYNDFTLRKYNLFLKYLIQRAPNIIKLSIKWRWTLESLNSISQLQYLQTLEIWHLGIRTIDENLFMNHIIEVVSIRTLTNLLLDVFNVGFYYFNPSNIHIIISSQTLQYLDVSHSRSLCICSINVPNLIHFCISKRVSVGNLVEDNDEEYHCLYNIFQKDFPSLKIINDHVLNDNWKEELYEDLDSVLYTICRCNKHITK